MKILSIDTSSNICGVAILENTTLLKEINQDNGLTHSETLMPIIKDTLESLNLDLKDIDLIVCDKGPGSFTGIRIGIATAKAFSDSLHISSIGISSLEALKFNIDANSIETLGLGSKDSFLVCTLIDAKKENCYWSVFENNKKIIDFSVDNIDNILGKLLNLNKTIVFIGDGSINYHDKISLAFPNAYYSNQNSLSAYKLGLAGYYNFKNNLESELMPLYLRKPQAERNLEEKLKNK